MKFLIFIVLAAAVAWLAVVRHDLAEKLEDAEVRAAKAEKSLEGHRKKYDWALVELNKFNPRLAQAITKMDSDMIASLKEKPETKTWLQERIEGRSDPLKDGGRYYYPDSSPYVPSTRPTTSGSRLIR